MARFALVGTFSNGLIPLTTCIVNGALAYDNDVDIHLIGHQDVPTDYLDQLDAVDRVVLTRWPDIVDSERQRKSQSGVKRTGWELRFYRYRYIPRIADKYDAVLIMDTDMFIVGNFHKQMELAISSGELVMPQNPRGVPLRNILNGSWPLEKMSSAASPSLHNMPLFFVPSKWAWLMEEVYEWGLKEPYGDMVTLFKTVCRNNLAERVIQLNNDLWVFTDYYFDRMVMAEDDQGRPMLTYKDERAIIVHRRWHMESVCRKFVEDVKQDHYRENARHNVECFKRCIEWLTKKGPVHNPQLGD